MKPFKLRRDLVDSPWRVAEIAMESLGQPSQSVIGDKSFSAIWEIVQPTAWSPGYIRSLARVNIGHVAGSEIISLGIVLSTEDSAGSEVHVSEDREPNLWRDMLDDFVVKAGRPWSDWTEDEIMSDTKWCRYFLESGGHPTEGIHNMMVMMSYENPEDSHIKEYFRIWKSRSSPEIS